MICRSFILSVFRFSGAIEHAVVVFMLSVLPNMFGVVLICLQRFGFPFGCQSMMVDYAGIERCRGSSSANQVSTAAVSEVGSLGATLSSSAYPCVIVCTSSAFRIRVSSEFVFVSRNCFCLLNPLLVPVSSWVMSIVCILWSVFARGFWFFVCTTIFTMCCNTSLLYGNCFASYFRCASIFFFMFGLFPCSRSCSGMIFLWRNTL